MSNEVIKPRPKGPNSSCLRVFFIILGIAGGFIVIVFLALSVFISPVWWRSIEFFSTNPNESTTTSPKASPEDTSNIDVIDGRILGEWDTGCLATASTSEGRDTYYERHTYFFNPNMTATHKRYVGASCAAMAETNTDNRYWKIPSTGKIDFYQDPKGQIATMDIYEISGETLKLGEGFRDRGGYGGVDSEGRMSSLNNFLVYKKSSGN